MSLQAMDWALRKVQGISPTQKLILICLANHAGPDGTCWPSQNTLSEYSGLSRESISRNLSDLERKGVIRSLPRRDDAGRDLSKTYFLNILPEAPAEVLNNTQNHRGVIEDHTGGTNMQGGVIDDHTQQKQAFANDQIENGVGTLGVIEDHTGVTQSHRGCDPESQGGVIEDHTSKENQSRKESVTRTKNISPPPPSVPPETPQAEGVYSKEFETFWAAYPKKIGKLAAWQAWEKMSGLRPPLESILRTIDCYRQTEQWQETRFIPHPSNWLAQRRFDDEPMTGGSHGRQKPLTSQEIARRRFMQLGEPGADADREGLSDPDVVDLGS